jgi:signal transduction histidine kinase
MRIVVADNGDSIAPDDLPKCSIRFSRHGATGPEARHRALS